MFAAKLLIRRGTELIDSGDVCWIKGEDRIRCSRLRLDSEPFVFFGDACYLLVRMKRGEGKQRARATKSIHDSDSADL